MADSSSSSSSSSSSGFLSSGDLKTGLSESTHFIYSSSSRRIPSYRALGSMSPRSGSGPMFFCDALSNDEPHHFLDACYLCKRPLGRNRDIFMYRGDTPFCSEECRQKQIEMDEGKEKKKKKNWSLSSSMKASSRTEQRKSKSTSPPKSESIRVRADSIVAG